MDPITKIIGMAKEDPQLKGVIPETVQILQKLLSKVKDRKSFESLINLLKKMAKTIREECPMAFPVFNIITQILSNLYCQRSDQDQQVPRLMRLLSNVEEEVCQNQKGGFNTFLFVLMPQKWRMLRNAWVF
jgi:translation initiation factor 2B subunit (eIF-2B alpha/beta/delta family)